MKKAEVYFTDFRTKANGDGLKGTDEVEVPVIGDEYVRKAKIGRSVMDAACSSASTISKDTR